MSRTTLQLTITIPKADVIQRVRVKASYKAGKVAGEGSQETYDKIELGAADTIILDKLWLEGAASVTSVMEDYCDTVNLLNVSNQYSAQLTMPNNWVNKSDMLTECVTEYIINSILYKWYENVAPKSVEFYIGEIALKTKEIVGILSTRKRPMRTLTPQS